MMRSQNITRITSVLGLVVIVGGCASGELDSRRTASYSQPRGDGSVDAVDDADPSARNSSDKDSANPVPIGGGAKSDILSLKSLEDGFQWLATSKSTGRAYKGSLRWFKMLGEGAPDLSLAPSAARHLPESNREFKVARWFKVPATEPCEYQFNFADPAKDTLQTVDVHKRGCALEGGSASAKYGFNRYGFRKCESETATFLGTKTIGSFVGSFGARIECVRGDYYSVQEIWYHPDSNHPHKKVMETGGYRRKEFGPYIRNIGRQTFENLPDIAPENEYEKAPMKSGVSYAVEGAVKSPGTVTGSATCEVGSSGQIETIGLPFLSIAFYQNRQWINGWWEPGFNVGSGSFSFGAFVNKNWAGGDIPGGTAAIRFERLGNTKYHRVSIGGSVALMNKYTGERVIHNVTAKSFTPFVCFANPATSVYRDKVLGEEQDF